MTTETTRQLDAEGRLPETPEERLEFSTRIAKAALEGLTTRASERIAFHERALAIAREMPDVWRIEQVATIDEVEHLIFSSLVQTDDAGNGIDEETAAALELLADEGGYRERDYLIRNPDATLAASELQALGVTVERPTPGEDVWVADGETFAGADLPAFVDTVRERPPKLGVAHKVADVLRNAPELGDKTKSALLEALRDDGGIP